MDDVSFLAGAWNRNLVDRRRFVLQAAQGLFGFSVLAVIDPAGAAFGAIHVKVTVKHVGNSPAVGVGVTIKEAFTNNTWNLGVTDGNGQVERDLRNRRQVDVFTQSFCRLPGCPTRKEDDQLDTPALLVTITDQNGMSFTAPPARAVYPGVEINVLLPPGFSSASANPVPVGHLLRRKNLNTDFSPAQQAQLADLVFGYVDDATIDAHMHQVDHLGNLFTDHRGFVYEIEKKLIRDGFTQFVPLPIWEPVNNLPSGWQRVKTLRGVPLPPLAPFDFIPVSRRPRLPEGMRPENICAQSFDTAEALAIAFGRSAASAPLSYHFNAHAVLGGPFMQMSTAAGALMFWPFHSLLVDVYDKWMTCKFGGKRDIQVGQYRTAGKKRIGLFRLGTDGQLWHSFQRLTCTMRNEADQVLSEGPVSFDHWSHWRRIGAPRQITRFKVVPDAQGRLVVLAAGPDGRLFTMRGVDQEWSAWRDLDAEVFDFSAALNPNGTLEIAAIKRRGTSWVVASTVDAPTASGVFGPWRELTQPVQPGSIEAEQDGAGRPHIFFRTSDGKLHHLWKRADATWSSPEVFSDAPVRMFKARRNQDGRLEVFVLRPQDDGIYHRWVNTGLRTIDWAAPGTWSGWARFGTTQFNHMAVGQNTDGRLEVFGVDTNGRLRHIWQRSPNAGWAEWEVMPHQQVIGARANQPATSRINQAITAVTDHTDRLKVFVQAEDDFIYMAEQTGASQGPWMGWTNL